jgi:hypothetical protein
MLWGELQDQTHGVVQADPPSWVHDHGSGAAASAHPAGDNIVADPHLAGGASAVRWPGPFASERSMCDADRREFENDT